ncbi:hypothetical protein C7E17_23665, partial [Stenotrophomonas maltophilia]
WSWLFVLLMQLRHYFLPLVALLVFGQRGDRDPIVGAADSADACEPAAAPACTAARRYRGPPPAPVVVAVRAADAAAPLLPATGRAAGVRPARRPRSDRGRS